MAADQLPLKCRWNCSEQPGYWVEAKATRYSAKGVANWARWEAARQRYCGIGPGLASLHLPR